MYPWAKTLRSLKNARLLPLMFFCAALAVVIIFCTVGLIAGLTAFFVELKYGWNDALVGGLVTGLILLIGSWFMLPALTVFVAGMFQEQAIHRVERVDYPAAMRKEEPKFWPDFWRDIKFTVWAVSLNILVLPFYFFLIGPLVSILLNSYLLGREFFESAAGHHLGKRKAKELYRQHRRVVFGGGLVITLMTLVPILNLFAPIIAVVWMVHVYHELSEGAEVG